jgi:hypothetical protein
MIDRQRVTTYGIAATALATIALAAWLKPWQARETDNPIAAKPDPVDTDKHRVDVVFAVDTTGSMGGLIDGAKRTVWSIASHIRSIDKQADLHIGLIAYRDLGDDYVTRDFALTGDLDAAFAELSSYQAAGGGDVPEDVDAALYDAVHKMQWRDGAKKLVFLVGDAPPASRGEVPKFDVVAKQAAEAQITINTIRCGVDSDTQRAWQQIAMIGNGEFSTIEQNGGVQQIVTPYDDKMAELSATVDSTAVIYGDSGVRHRYEGKMAATTAAPAPAKADRAAYYATKGGGGRAAEDIVAGVGSGTVSVEALNSANLPAEMQALSKDELKAELDKRVETRKTAEKEISELAKKRADFLRDHAARDGEGGFDAKVKATVEHQLK